MNFNFLFFSFLFVFLSSRDRSQILWRIDRDEMASGINTAKANLVNLFSDERKMELVVDFRKPVFSPWPIDKSIPSNHFSTLNPIQQEAILKCKETKKR